MSEHETVADIIAEKRREANYIVQVAQGKCQTRRDKAEDEARNIRREADRLEAAHKRAMEAVGNSAQLREAVEYCLGVLNRIDWLGDGVFPNGKFIAPETLARAKQKATSALNAPARNCDTNESIDAVVKRFKAENCDHYDNAFDDPRTQCYQNCVECVIKWMMANLIKEDKK